MLYHDEKTGLDLLTEGGGKVRSSNHIKSHCTIKLSKFSVLSGSDESNSHRDNWCQTS